MSSQRPANPFSADRPIRSKSEDLLERSMFAESLADVVEGWTGNDSLVIALYGPWGIGKSSIKNMMLEHLRQKGDLAPTVVEFAPWQWATQDQIAEAFFREIALALGKKDDAKDAKKRADKFSAYAAYLKAGSHVASGFRPLLTFVVASAGVFGLAGAFLKAAWLKPYLAAGGIVALTLAGMVNWSTSLAEKAAAALSARQKLKEKSLQDTKSEVADILLKLKRPILVVIDDLDRLTADEVRLIFQLIKANADFPNLVYLTLFQRDIVELNLDKVTSGTGKNFLEKIVQVGFDVPQVQKGKLQSVLFARLNEILADPKVSKNFNQYRWQKLFATGLDPYFETLRDVYRFLSVLDVQIASMAPRGSFEVNPIDLITLEVLRVFEPSVYQLLPRNKSRLTKFSSSLFRRPSIDSDKDYKSRRDTVVASASSEKKEVVKKILEDLFPDISPGNEAVYFRELRVCHPDVFDRYFLLTIPDGDLSQADIDDLLESTGDREGLVAQFAELRKRGLREVALDRLEAYKEEVDPVDAVPFISALLDFGDDLPEPEMGTLSPGSWMIAARIIRSVLMKEPDKEKRYEYLSQAIGNSDGLYLSAMIVGLEADMHKENRPSYDLLVETDSLEKLKSICAEKIRQAADSGLLPGHPKLPQLLDFWREWKGSAEVSAWVDKFTQSSTGVITFLEAMLQRSVAYETGSAPRISWYMPLEAMAPLINTDELERRIRTVEPSALNDSQGRALNAFQEALARLRDEKAKMVL